MLRLAPLLCLLLAACQDPLTAWVGVVADAAQAPSAIDARLPPTPVADASAPSDAALLAAEAGSTGACLDLPDLVATALTGPAANAAVKVATIAPSSTCLALDAGATAGPPESVYQLARLDGAPLLRGGRRYALSWPPPGKATSFVGVISEVYGSTAACELGEHVGSVNRGISSRGCTELRPTLDASFLNLPALTFLGLGVVEFTLCEGPCSP